MNKTLSFSDVLIVPQWSDIKSRKDVDLSQKFCGITVNSPFISSNMDSVTESKMTHAMNECGAMGALHRFCTIKENVEMFKNSPKNTIVSIGLGDKELQRAEALYLEGATIFLIDVANGANSEVLKQYKQLKKIIKENSYIIVGNFATRENILKFKEQCDYPPDAYKVGIGGGSACLTRLVSGCGLPTFSSILDCASTGETIIADGGIRNSGDATKALAAGATMVMIGRLLAGCDESPGQVYINTNELADFTYFSDLPDEKQYHLNISGKLYKKYRGSASAESYEVQGKTAEHRAPEGDSYLVPYVGPVEDVLNKLNAGIRSGCSYVGANNLTQLREKAKFVEVTPSGAKESDAHGKL